MIARLEADVIQTKQSKAKARILRNLKKAEELRKLFLKIKTLRQSKQRNGITRIEIPIDPNDDPKTCINWKTIDVPTEILYHLQQRNRRHFGRSGTRYTVHCFSTFRRARFHQLHTPRDNDVRRPLRRIKYGVVCSRYYSSPNKNHAL